MSIRNTKLSRDAARVLSLLCDAMADVIEQEPQLSQTGMDRHAQGELRVRIRDAADGVISLRDAIFAVLGANPTEAGRRRFHRTLDDLEAAGLVQRIAKWGGRTTHLQVVEE